MTILGADDEGRLRALLDSLGYDLEPSILIGGWATNARVGGEISHDIDLIITDQSLRQRLPERLTEYSENHLHSGGRKARGNADGVHVDAYFPYESKLGTRPSAAAASSDSSRRCARPAARSWSTRTACDHPSRTESEVRNRIGCRVCGHPVPFSISDSVNGARGPDSTARGSTQSSRRDR